MSFVNVMAAIKSTLESDPDLRAFCKDTWARELTVIHAWKKRQEIPKQSLPIILITSPSVGKRKESASGREAWRRVRLYFGFYQTDRSRGVLEQIIFEELIDAALAKDTSLDGVALEMKSQDSANDEGVNHPAWFTAMDLEILYVREWIDWDALPEFLQLHAGYDLASPDQQLEAEDDVEVPQ